MRNPPRSTADEFELGIPRLSIGTSAVQATVLLAASGAAIPSGEPLPNSSLRGDQRRASLYARNAEIVPPPPGMIPSKVPITEPISCGRAILFHILVRGNVIRASLLEAFSHAGSLARSEEHTSVLQSPCNLVCHLLLETTNISKSYI